MSAIPVDTLVRTFPFSEGLARLCFSHDGKYLFTAGCANFLRVYDADDERGEVEPALCNVSNDPEVELLSIDCSVSPSALSSWQL